MVTAKDGEIDKVVGLEIGADDYVTKPFSSRELLARIRAVLRRHGEPDELISATVEAGPVRMDVDRHVVTVRGEAVALPLKEFDLLELLVRNAGRVLTRAQLIDRVWGSDYVGDTKTLDVHVKRLRAKIEADPADPCTWSRCAAWATSSSPDERPGCAELPAAGCVRRVRGDALVVADRRDRSTDIVTRPAFGEAELDGDVGGDRQVEVVGVDPVLGVEAERDRGAGGEGRLRRAVMVGRLRR